MLHSSIWLILGIVLFAVPIFRQQKEMNKISYHKYSQKINYNLFDICFFIAGICFILQFLISIF